IRNMQLTRDFERKQLQEEKKKQEEKEERQYFIKLEEYLHQFDERLKELYEQIKKEIDYEITRLRINTIEHLKNKIDVDELLYGLKNRVYAVIEKINTCFIKPNFRYNHEYYLLEAIDKCNSDIESKKHILRSYADEAILVLKSEILNKLDILLRSQDLYDNLNGKLLSIMNWIESFYKQGAEQIGFEEVRCLEKELTDFHNKIITIARNEIEEKKKYLINEQNRLKSQHNIFKLLNERLHSLEFYAEPEKLRLEIEKSITEFESTIIKVQDRKIELLDSINDSVKLKSITQFITRLNNNINNTGFFNFEDEYIGLMKKEVNMYRDLSAIGLAAELTSHEFNTLYSTIRNNLNNLHHALSETKILPYVENTKVAFNSLERLHQRMSPLYRQSRYKQKEIRLNELVVNVLEYFKADLERYEIKTILDIPPNVVIRELDTVLFTPLVNLISNAIYWTMNKETRSIYFYMSSDYESLYIHDTGMGISEKDINRIFEPFFTKKVGGRGIGLYLSRDILESRGHQLYSITPGEEPRPIGGACFCIRFNKDTMLGGNL
ncbi:MAG TPA: HAMP domain-containing sensor histidine kinase, partial [Patescibacteria group bacterium]|nr:HAMP domain-containing sensor histidine kinase [Patescibacteria group bacterium]